MGNVALPSLSSVPLYSIAGNIPIFYHKPLYRYNAIDLVHYGLNAAKGANFSQDSSFDAFNCGDSISWLVSALFGNVQAQCLEYC